MDESRNIQLQVLFFGATADVAGARSVVLDLPEKAVSGDAYARLLEQYPGLASHKLLYSVNQTYADGSEPLKSNDELAIFTAVSGG